VKETGKINYIEMRSRDLEATKRFFGDAFGWSFIDYGPEYVAIENAGLMVASSSQTMLLRVAFG